MTDRPEATRAELEHYADTLAHELRSPVNRLLQSAEVALLRTRTAGEYEEILGGILEDSRRLARILDGLLFLARLDHGRQDIASEPVDLARELRSVLELYEGSAEDAGVALSMACEPGVLLTGDSGLMQRAIGNVVSNAVDHTPAGGTIRVQVTQADDLIRISINDTGCGIAPEHLPHVFEPFYRAGNDRSPSAIQPPPEAAAIASWTLEGQLVPRRATSAADYTLPSEPFDLGDSHLGLGLAIVRSILTAHGGTATVASVVGTGTSFVLTFPVHRLVTSNTLQPGER
jgi:two-component system, OmpR family, heavy metal sensor histidine kinase CusS